MPGSSVNELAGIDAAQLPTTHAAYDMGNAAAAGCGYQYLSGHGWFEQHLSGGADRFSPLAPSIRNTWDGGIVVFQDGTVGRLIKVCDDPRASGPGDYIYFKTIPGVNANQGFTRIVGTAQPNTAVAVYDGQTLLGTVHSDADGHWSYGAVGLADCDHHMHTLAGGTTSATMLVHVAGDRVTVTAEAAALGGVIEDDAAQGSASGQLVVNDADLGDNPVFVAQQDVHGAYGTFSIDGQGHWTYTLDNGAAATQSLTDGQHETETFQVAVTTDSGEHAVRDVTVTVTGTNDLPTATAASVAMDEDHSYTFSASDFGFADVDAGATLDHVTILSLPTAAEGQLLLNGQAVSANQQIDTADIPHLVFQPAADFNGNVAFRYAVNDGSADSAPVSGTLVVRPVDDSSQITGDDQVDIIEGAGATSHPDLTVQKGAWIANGVPHDTLPQVTPGDPSTGRWYTTGGTDKDVHVDGMPGTLHFPSGFWLMNMGDPSYGFHGWQLFPRSGTSATAQYSAVPVDAEGDLQIQDIDSPTPTFTNVDSQLGDNGYGTFSMHGGHWTFVTNDKAEALPDGVSATETITFQASDGTTHTVTVRITGSDAASRIEGDLAASIMESRTGTDVQAQGVLTVVDPDTGENPTLPDFSDQVGDNGYGHFSMTNGHWTYVLDPAASDRMQAGIDYQDQITIRASDGREQTIVISITGTNDAPTVTATSISSAEDTVHTFSAADFGFNDPDSNDTLDHVTITGLPDPAQGQLLLDGQAVTQGDQIAAANISKLEFRPAQDFNGDATFRYTVSDSHQATSAEATGTITVNAVNDAPVVTANDAAHAVNMGVAAEDTTQTFSEADLLRLTGATDIDGDTLSISAVHIDPAFGSFASDGHGTWTFTPAANVHRDDIEITITVSDQHTTTDAHALLDITPVTDAPTPTLTLTAQQQVMEFAPNSASGVVTDGTVSAGGGMTALTVDMTILGGQQVATSAGHGATFISYATPSDSNAMYIWKPEDLTFRIGGHEYPTGVALMNDGADHRYTFSWDGAHGTLDVLVDGQAVKHLTGIGQGVTLADGGKFALGNDQDSFGGGFSTGDAFTGKMFNVAVAKAAIDPTRLQDAPLGTLLQGDADLLTDVRVLHGQFHDATGNSQYHAVGQVHTTTVEVDTSIASPNPGASLSLDFSAGAPGDTTDTVTAQRVFGFPAGTIVTDGHGHTVTVADPGAVIDLAGWQMDSVQAQLPPAYRGNMNIGYAVTTTGPDGSPETAVDHSPVILDPTQPVPDAAIQGDDAEATDEDSAVSGHLSITDADAGEAHFVAQADTNGQYGHFSLTEDGQWTYTPDDRADTLADGAKATETFSVASADGSHHVVSIELIGKDDGLAVQPPPAPVADEPDLGAPVDDYMIYADTGAGSVDGSSSDSNGGSDVSSPVDDYLAAAGIDPTQASGSTDATMQDAPMPNDTALDTPDTNTPEDPNVDDTLIDIPDTLIEDDPQHHDV